VWLGLFEPGEKELAQMRETFGLHELAVEDALTLHRHPKIVSYDEDVQLVVVRTARYDDATEQVDFGEISVFVAPTFVITVRQGVATDLTGVRQRLEERPKLLATGSSSVLWAVLGAVVDAYAPVVLEVERDVDDIEATVFSQQNRTIQQLTILATIFLPLTFITGFFGQNFGWLVDHVESLPAFLVYGIGGPAVPLVLLIRWMRLRMPHADTRAVVGETAGAARN